MKLHRMYDLQELRGAQKLIFHWRELSFAQCWRMVGDWLTNETEVVAEMISFEGQLSKTLAQQLGKSRATMGVGISESVQDFRLLYQAAARPVDLDSLQAFVEGWVMGWDPEPAISCTDPRTGLSTTVHLYRLVSDLLDSAENSEQFLLAAVHFDQQPLSQGSQSWEFDALLGEICRQQLVETGAVLAYDKGVLLALINRSSENFAALLKLQSALVEAFGEATGRTHLEYQALSKDVHHAFAFLDSFGR